MLKLCFMFKIHNNLLIYLYISSKIFLPPRSPFHSFLAIIIHYNTFYRTMHACMAYKNSFIPSLIKNLWIIGKR